MMGSPYQNDENYYNNEEVNNITNMGFGGGNNEGFLHDGGFSRKSMNEPMSTDEIRRLDAELQAWVMKSRYQLTDQEKRPLWKVHNLSVLAATGITRSQERNLQSGKNEQMNY